MENNDFSIFSVANGSIKWLLVMKKDKFSFGHDQERVKLLRTLYPSRFDCYLSWFLAVWVSSNKEWGGVTLIPRNNFFYRGG